MYTLILLKKLVYPSVDLSVITHKFPLLYVVD